jgi:hypothetical protein
LDLIIVITAVVVVKEQEVVSRKARVAIAWEVGGALLLQIEKRVGVINSSKGR